MGSRGQVCARSGRDKVVLLPSAFWGPLKDGSQAQGCTRSLWTVATIKIVSLSVGGSTRESVSCQKKLGVKKRPKLIMGVPEGIKLSYWTGNHRDIG